jgi:Uma2 family endonuclease
VHDLLAMNLVGLLRSAARARGCDVHGSNLKVVSPVGIVTYPDVFVRCGPLANEVPNATTRSSSSRCSRARPAPRT